MKKLIILLSALFIGAAVMAQGIAFQKESYAEVLKMAKKQRKLVFIDVYTSWCGPCKHMATKIFPEAKAGEFYNAHFLNLQLDAEKSEDGKMVAKTFGVNAFPTFLFVNGDGELVYRFLGGRSVDMFVQEGQKAVDAFAAQPELKKYAKKYEKGNRDLKFLNQYYLLKDKSGLDCSDVLIDYFAQLSDEQLVDTINAPRIAKLTVYEPALAERIVTVVSKEAVRPDKNKEQFSVADKAVNTFLSACLKDAARADDDATLNAVLALKDRWFKAAGHHDSATSASLGGGNIYVPSDLLRIDYYTAHKKNEQFVSTLESYIAAVQKKYEESLPEKRAMLQALDEKMKAAKESGNEDELAAAKRMAGMMLAFSSIDDYYVSTSLIEDVERYEEIYTGAKDKAFGDKVADWYIFLHRLSPSAKTAVYVADKLLAKDRKAEAVGVLELGLKEGAKAPGVEKEDVTACEQKLQQLKAEK